jgi:hypothetical protein
MYIMYYVFYAVSLNLLYQAMEIHVYNFVFILLMIQYTVNLNNICVLIVSLILGEFVVGQHIF